MDEDLDKIFDEIVSLIPASSSDDEIMEYMNKLSTNQVTILSKKTTRYVDETLLMLATYFLRFKLVMYLVNKGADPKYINLSGDSCSTYWPFNYSKQEGDLTEQELCNAADIAIFLHGKGVDFGIGGRWTYGLLKRTQNYNLETMSNILKELGYLIY